MTPAFAQGETVTLSKAEYDALLARVERIEQLLSKTAPAAPRAARATPKPAPHPAPQVEAKQEEQEKRILAVEETLATQTARADEDRTRLATIEQAAAYVSWSYDNGRPNISTGDGRFSLALRGRWQFDAASFMQDNFAAGSPVQFKDLSSGAVIRRGYFGVEGRAYKDFWYEFRMNFGGSNAEGAELNLARVAYVGIPGFRINAGVIQPVFTYGDTVSSGSLTFIERDQIVNVATAAFGGSDARRGIEVSYQKGGLFSPTDYFFVAGSYTGSSTGVANGHGNGFDEQTQVNGRMGYRFWQDGTSSAQIGVSGARVLSAYSGATPNAFALSERPGVRVDATSLVTTGVMAGVNGASMFGIDGGFNIDNFYVMGEYHKYRVDRFAGTDPEFSGFYVEASYVLTGEPKVWGASLTNNEVGSWTIPAVIKPFSLDGESWGAWEILAKYSSLDLNYNEGVAGVATPVGGVRGGEQTLIIGGVNWYLNRNVRMQFNYIDVDVDKISTAAPFPQQGQEFNILAGRLQFAF